MLHQRDDGIAEPAKFGRLAAVASSVVRDFPANYKWFRDLAISEIVKTTLEVMSLRWPEPSAEVEPARRALKKLK